MKSIAITPEEQELIDLFATYGPEVRSADVPELVRSGVVVFSFGYGEDDGLDGFDAIEESDLWAWDPEEDALDVVESWAPFRLDADTSDKVKRAYAAFVAATSN